MSISYEDRKNFRNFVLNLKRLNTTWSVARMVHFIQNCDNPPPLKYKSLHNCISRILKRGDVNDKKRSGRPVTTTTLDYQQNVNHHISLYFFEKKLFFESVFIDFQYI